MLLFLLYGSRLGLGFVSSRKPPRPHFRDVRTHRFFERGRCGGIVEKDGEAFAGEGGVVVC